MNLQIESTVELLVEVIESNHPKLGTVYCTFVQKQIVSVVSKYGSHDIDPYPDSDMYCVDNAVATYTNPQFIPLQA